jgi:hypothetical protein
LAWRWTESRRIAIAGVGLAALIPPLFPSPPAPPAPPPGDGGGGGVSVKIASTGDKSETRQTVPIARRPGGGSRVAMSMTPSQLPSLDPGDVLAVSAEVQVTTDCLNGEPPRQCKGSSYRYNPVVGAQLVLAGNSEAATGSGTLALEGRRRIVCRQKLPSREHHCMIVFTAAELPVADPSSLPCAPQCHVNLVIDAHNPRARANDRLIIGSTGPNGGVVQDKGRINVIRTRGADPSAQPLPTPPGTVTAATHSPLIGGLTLDKPPRKAVVYSQPVEGLEAREQLAARAIMKTGVVRLRHNANVSAQIILADSPTAIHPSKAIRDISLLGGEITENNGFNCTQRTTPCTTDKVGVLGIIHDAPGIVYVNVVLSIGRIGGRSPGDNLVRVTEGGLELTRYPPED